MQRNIIIGQSGGPTAVINSSLAGVFKTAKDRGAGKIYGMRYGIHGLLEHKYVDLSEHIRSDLDIDLLKRTPSSFLGSCRYKLPEIKEDHKIYEQIFSLLQKLEIEAFFYIGGNDSMDTIQKLSDYGHLIGSDIRFMGVPKTIDNDLSCTDHTPGYGSAAKFIAAYCQGNHTGRSGLRHSFRYHYGNHGTKRRMADRSGGSRQGRGLRRCGSDLSSGGTL